MSFQTLLRSTRLRRAAVVLGGVAAALSVQAASLTEGFASTTTAAPIPTGWTGVNNSSPVGLTSWTRPASASPFAAQAGTTTSYIYANFDSVDNLGTISNWLILPTLTFNNGDTFSFYTRTTQYAAFADRLEVRFSDVGGTNVGTTDTSVGTFTTTLLTVNPTLATSAYPETWTQYTATITGLSGPTSGAIAFRYFVTDAGGIGNYSNFVAIDTVQITAVPEPSAWLLMALGGGALVLAKRRRATQA